MQGYANFRTWAGAGLLLAGSVCAQDPEPESTAPEMGGGRWLAQVRGAGFYTDNFFYEPTTPQSASGWLINPALGYLTETARTRLSFDAGGEYGTFDVPGSADDYLDGSAALKAGLQASTRNRLELMLDGRRGHDPFGLDRTEGAPPSSAAELDEWNEAAGGVRHRFGTSGAVLNTELGASGLRRHYLTNRAATQFLDYEVTTLDGAIFYNYSPKTSALVDFSRSDYDFEYAFAGADNRSGELYRARVGVKWQATAKTAGDVRVGYRERSFEDSDETFRGADWEAGIEWRPVWPAMIKFSTGRTEQPSYLSGVRAIDARHASAQWHQPWTNRFNSSLGVSALRADFLGNGRSDDFGRAHLNLEYRLSSHAAAIVNVTFANRESTTAAREYERVSSFAGIQVGL